jgi:hypothetical protein
MNMILPSSFSDVLLLHHPDTDVSQYSMIGAYFSLSDQPSFALDTINT